METGVRERVWDAIVVGAGPAGSTCATDLAAAGCEALLLERDRAPGDSANCTGIIARRPSALSNSLGTW